MAITLECAGCHATLLIKDEFAGKTGKCMKCGARLRIPSLGGESQIAQPGARLLAEATLDEMLHELGRRGAHGVLSMIDLDRFGVDGLADLVASGQKLASGIECRMTEPLTETQRQKLYGMLAEGLARKADPAAAAESDAYYEPFELKGDKIGMSLIEFKTKYRRDVPSTPHPAPYCSDANPGVRDENLLTERWHAAARIVHGRIEYPHENSPPTIAGETCELLLYQFLDGNLFQITAFLPPDAVHHLAESLRKKYGPPGSSGGDPQRLTWTRLAACVELTYGKIRPRTPARLRFFSDDLLREAMSRQPKRTDDL